MEPIEQKAKKVASFWHRGLKYGVHPYEKHLQDVRDVLIEYGHTDPELLAAAWLHDILEDTDYPVRELAKEFGPRITNIVWACTGFGANRAERFDDLCHKIHNGEQECAIVKSADRIANIRASLGTPLEQMYQRQAQQFMQIARRTNMGQYLYDFANLRH